MEQKLREFITCLQRFTAPSDEQLVMSRRPTFILGFVGTATACLCLAQDLVRTGYSILVTFQLSQDHLKSFFGKLPGMGCCNNNPTSGQLKRAIKKLLARQYVTASAASNCLNSGTNSGVFAFERRKAPVGEESNFELPYYHTDLTNLPTNSILCENILFFIAGFVVRSLHGPIKCPTRNDAMIPNK